MNGFMCIGSVRGWCGRRHRTVEAARACIARDQQACSRRGGYSDRWIYPASAIRLNAAGQPVMSVLGDHIEEAEE